MSRYLHAAIYDRETGRIYSVKAIGTLSDTMEGVFCDGRIDPKRQYIDPDTGEAKDRPELRATLDREHIAADGEDAAIIGPLPIPCQVKIGGQETVVIDDGEIEITADQPDEIEVEIEQWPYYPKTFVIVAGDDG